MIRHAASDMRTVLQSFILHRRLDGARRTIREIDASYRLPQWLSMNPADASRSIQAAGRETADAGRQYHWAGISPYVVPTVLWSLYSFRRTPDDYFETICTAIAVGGDVDTTAAIAGAISGAFVGLEGIPRQLALRVTDRGSWGFDELNELGKSAWAMRARDEFDSSYISTPPREVNG